MPEPVTELRAGRDLDARIERLEAIAALLCQHAAAGQGSMGKPFWDFINTYRQERIAQNQLQASNSPVGGPTARGSHEQDHTAIRGL